ncbi:MAG: HAD family phosphatase [Planctomycetota bacterium]
MTSFPPPAKPLRAVAFDMDGTLASSEDVYLHVGHETLRRRGKAFEDDLRHAMMGRPAASALQVMIDWHELDDTVEGLAAESEELFWRFAGQELAPLPGVTEMFDWLDQHQIRRGIATSGSRVYASRILELIGLAGRFEFAITADDVQHGKPNPEPYLLAAERLGVEPEEMLVVEDYAVGAQSAVAAGAYTVAAPNHHTASHEFVGVAFVAKTMADARIRQALLGAT